MADFPPPLPRAKTRRRKTLLIVGIVLSLVLFLGLGVFFTVRAIVESGITKGPDAMFGDQYLKTAVALIELHKVRFGKYPETLQELKFTGQWDQVALQSVFYRSNTDHTAYYVEVSRGWIGKPDLEIPQEFWQGTGYSKDLKPKSP